MASASDEKLMELLVKGNRKALEILYTRYADKLYGYLLKSLNFDEEKAADLLHDIFLKVGEKPQLFDLQKNFKTWLFTVATNLLKNEWRSEATKREKIETVSAYNLSYFDEDVSATIDREWLMEKLKMHLSQLSEVQQQLIHLRYTEECTVPQIAQIMNLPEGTVKSRLFYVMKQLTEKLNAYQSIHK